MRKPRRKKTRKNQTALNAEVLAGALHVIAAMVSLIGSIIEARTR